MLGFIIKSVFGSKNEREIRRVRPMAARINEIELGLQSQPEEVLREKTAQWKAKLLAIQDNVELTKELNAIPKG